MPTTVNGIGTHYYGKREFSSRMGRCQHCGAETRLESYTTRLWFVILFIPIIPLKRVRLIDYCPRCQRHWVANPEQYEMSRQLAVSGAMESYNAHPSVDAAIVVHAQLLSFHMHTEADRFREAVLTQYPGSAELRAGLASHLDQTGRWMEGTPLYEEAYRIQPEIPEVRSSLAWRRSNENNLDEAYDLLDFMRQPGAGQTFNLAQLETLAESYQKQGNHERALELMAILLREFPETGDKHKFRQMVTRSEKALNLSSSILPEKAFSLRGLLDKKSGTHAPWVRNVALATIATVLFVIGMAGMNEYYRQHRTLYIVNAFAQPLTVSLDGGPPVAVSNRASLPVSEGAHTLQLTGPVNRQADLDLQSGYWSRWTYSPAWVFNVERVAGLTSTKLQYAANPVPSTSTWLNDVELNFVPHVDYLFEEPPATLRVEGKNNVVTKVHVGMKELPPATVVMNLQDRVETAMTFAEGQLDRNPNDATLLNVYAHISIGEHEQRAVEFLKAGLWRKPISILWHRAYQYQKSVAANEAAMAEEYDAQLKQSPEDAGLLYLRGRVGRDRAEQLKYFHLAEEKDPQLGWPAMALAYDAANRGAWPEAKTWCDKVTTLRSDPSFRGLLHVVRLANGDAAAMEGEYRQQLDGTDYVQVVTSLFCLIDTLASQQKYEEARKSVRDWLIRMAGPDATAQTLASFDLTLDYVCGDLEGMRKQTEVTVGQAEAKFQCLLALGDPDAATHVEEFEKMSDDWSALLAVSVGYSSAGNVAEAKVWRDRACDKLREGDNDQKRAAALLSADHPPTDEELDDVTLRVNDTALMLAALSQLFSDRQQPLRERAERLNISRLHPYLLVKRAIGPESSVSP